MITKIEFGQNYLKNTQTKNVAFGNLSTEVKALRGFIANKGGRLEALMTNGRKLAAIDNETYKSVIFLTEKNGESIGQVNYNYTNYGRGDQVFDKEGISFVHGNLEGAKPTEFVERAVNIFKSFIN